MDKCKACGFDIEKCLTFGDMPIANAFVEKPNEDVFRYNLSVGFCPNCFLVQLIECVEPLKMFNKNYAYYSSTSTQMDKHFQNVADELANRIQNKQSPFVVEIGCNDGIMLKNLKNKGINHLGVEPSENVAIAAKEKGINIFSGFFNRESANEIMNQYGKADVIFGANVICHIENIKSVFEGVATLLKDDGIMIFEDPYLLDIIKNGAFDQFYDEHIFYFSGLAVVNIAKLFDLSVIDMKRQVVHGGSMRYYLQKRQTKAENPKIQNYIDMESLFGLDRIKTYYQFMNLIDSICDNLRRTINKIKANGFRIAGYGATSKSTTLLNYAKINSDSIEYITDTTPTKIGKYTPGTHIPIRSHNFFSNDFPDFTLLLAWNHKNEILEKEHLYRKKGGKFITFFPDIIIE